jgi:DNA topoisomerase-3
MKPNKLWLTEKPDMAKNLVNGLVYTYGLKVLNPGQHSNDGCYKLSNGDAVAYLFGHMLGLAPPEAYLSPEQSRSNAFTYLPLMPDNPIKVPKAERLQSSSARRDGPGRPSKQYLNLVSLLRSAKEIVNSGDIDREGQLIMDELISSAGIDPHGRNKPVWRLALSNPDEREIKKMLDAGLDNNSDPRWARASEAAAAREYSDWCLGMTASRAYRQVTGYSRMSVGRVQTPTLALVVRREIEIERFRQVNHFVPVITLADGTKMRWHQREGAQGLPGFDTEGRILDEAVAKQICASVMGVGKGVFTLAEAQDKFIPPPLPFSYGVLQSTVSRRHGMTLKQVEQAAKALYERHKMISYVGTDCQYLPTSMLDQARDTMNALGSIFPRLAQGADMGLRSRGFNDDKLDEHFAIVPLVPPNGFSGNLNQDERNVFETVSKRFIAQFYPAHQFTSMKLHAMFNNIDEFRATEKMVVRNGWKDVEGDSQEQNSNAAESDEDVHTEIARSQDRSKS